MKFLPLVRRQLLVLPRWPGTYWLRTATAAGFTLLALFILWEDGPRSATYLGRVLFMGLAAASFIAALGGGPVLTADSISSEKRDGTLGLLFLTDLKGHDIVLGKLAAGGIQGLCVLLASMPVLALPLLLGGVNWTQFWQTGLVVLNALFFGLAAGLFISAISRQARTAVVAALGTVFFLSVGIIVCEGLWFEFTAGGYQEPAFARISPAVGFVSAAVAGPMMPNRLVMYWQSLCATHLMAWLFLIAAARILPHVWQERALSVRQTRWRERLTLWSVGRAEKRRAYRTRLLDRSPVCWLDDRYRLQKSVLWAVLLAALTFGMWLWSLYPEDLFDEDVVFPTVIMANGVLLVWLAVVATHRLAEDKRSGALELLLATPVSIREIVMGRLLALWRQFGWVFVCVQTVTALMYAGMIWYRATRYGGLYLLPPDYFPAMTCIGLAGLVMFTLYAAAIALLGQWFALTDKHSILASVMTVVAVVGLHWAGMFAMMSVLYRIDPMGALLRGPWFILSYWFGFGALVCVFWMRYAWRQLHQHFREAASRVPLRNRFWELLKRRLGMAAP